MIINGVRVESPNKVTLCGDKICCPTLERLANGKYVLTDDDGNSVILTAEQAKLINAGVEVINNKTIKEQLICG